MAKIIWFVPPAIHVVAARRGLLEDGQVVVEASLAGSSDEQFEALADGSQDLAVTAMDNVILWNRRGRGDDYRIVAQVERTTAISLVAQAPFESVAALAGKRLLVDCADNGFVIALRAMLHDAGVAFDDCTIIPAGGVKERFAAMVAGQGDATLLGPPFVGMAQAQGMRCLVHADQAFPGFPGQGVVVRTSRLAELGSETARWLKALDAARAVTLDDPAAAIADLVAVGMPDPVARILVDAVGDTLVPARAGIALLLDHRRRLGLPGADTNYDGVVETGLLPMPAQMS